MFVPWADQCSTGIGGDAFALFYNGATKRVECLQGCGRSPAGLTLQAVRAHPEMTGRSITGVGRCFGSFIVLPDCRPKDLRCVAQSI